MPLSLVRFDIQAKEIKTFKKNNFFIHNFEKVRDDLNSNSFKMDNIITTTAFIMADKLNRQNIHFDATTKFLIDIQLLNELWGVKNKAATGYMYRSVLESCRRLRAKEFKYPVQSNKIAYSGLFADIESVNGEISFTFPNALIPHLQDFRSYTWLWFDSILSLSGCPVTTALFEYLCSYRYLGDKNSKNQIIIDVPMEKIRSILDDRTSRTVDFIRRKLNPVVENINSKTNVTLKCNKRYSSSKTIIGFNFILDFSSFDKSLSEANDVASRNKNILTKRQILSYSKKLIKDTGFVSAYPKKKTETKPDYLLRIENDLNNNIKVFEYYPYLKEVGFINEQLEEKYSRTKTN